MQGRVHGAPERIVLLMIGAITNRMAGVLWVVLVLSILAVANRIYYTFLALNKLPMPSTKGAPASSTARSSGPTSAQRSLRPLVIANLAFRLVRIPCRLPGRPWLMIRIDRLGGRREKIKIRIKN
jgi:hypothetical protein